MADGMIFKIKEEKLPDDCCYDSHIPAPEHSQTVDVKPNLENLLQTENEFITPDYFPTIDVKPKLEIHPEPADDDPYVTKRSTPSDWITYSPTKLKRRKHDLLKTPEVNGDDDIQRTERRVFPLPDKLLARRRPAVPLKQAAALFASTERFSKLADTKRDLADAQRTAFLKEHDIYMRIKQATLEEIQLDIEIKKLRYEATLEEIQLDIEIKKMRLAQIEKGEHFNDELTLG